MPSDSPTLALEPRQRTRVLSFEQRPHLGLDLAMVLIQPLLLLDGQER